MKFKLIIVMAKEEKTDTVIDTARENGATGCTVITSARGEGLNPAKSFMGLTIEGQRDVVLMLVEEHLSRHILESLCKAGRFEEEPGSGIALQIDIEDVIGLGGQIKKIEQEIENDL